MVLTKTRPCSKQDWTPSWRRSWCTCWRKQWISPCTLPKLAPWVPNHRFTALRLRPSLHLVTQNMSSFLHTLLLNSRIADNVFQISRTRSSGILPRIDNIPEIVFCNISEKTFGANDYIWVSGYLSLKKVLKFGHVVGKEKNEKNVRKRPKHPPNPPPPPSSGLESEKTTTCLKRMLLTFRLVLHTSERYLFFAVCALVNTFIVGTFHSLFIAV